MSASSSMGPFATAMVPSEMISQLSVDKIGQRMDARKCKDRERKRLKRAEMKERGCCKDKLEKERERAKEYYEKNKEIFQRALCKFKP